jgi:hypothetical protein
VALGLIMLFLEPILHSRSSTGAAALRAEVSNPHGLGLIVFHFFNGAIIYPLGFAFFAAQLKAPWLVRGLFWGIIVWLLAGAVLMPILGFGFFGSTAGGLRLATTSLVAHLAYGAVQGLVAAIPPRKMD